MTKRLTLSQLLAAAVLLTASLAQTQTVPVLGLGCKFQWDPYVNTDNLAVSFKMYLNKDGVQMPAKTGIPVTATTITCQAAGITQAGLWKANLHAVGADGTESAPSNGLTWTVKVIGPPLNFRAIP